MLFCGRASVTGCDEELEESCPSTVPKTPKKSIKESKNPFSSRGLDRFAIVSEELHSRTQKIMSQLGATQTDNILVRFAYSSSKGWTPVIVRPKKAAGENAIVKPDEKQEKRSVPAADLKPVNLTKKTDGSVVKANTSNEEGRHGAGSEGMKERGLGLSSRLDGWFGLRQVYYGPLAFVLLFASLLVFGRLAAILCTTIWLYFFSSFFAVDSKKQAANEKKETRGFRSA